MIRKQFIALASCLLLGFVAHGCSSDSRSKGYAPVEAPSSDSAPVASSPATTPPQPPPPAASATELLAVEFQDTDSSATVSRDDLLLLTFSSELGTLPNSPDPEDDLTLPILHNGLGANARLEAGPVPTQAQVVLGFGARLRIGGVFDPNADPAGAPSGLNIASQKFQDADGNPIPPAANALDIQGDLPLGFRRSAAMKIPRSGHQAVLLDDGRVLVVGGNGAREIQAEIYDPLSEECTLVTTLSGDPGLPKVGGETVPLYGEACKLADGTVFAMGVRVGLVDQISCFLFDPKTNTFRYLSDMPNPRRLQSTSLALLPDGRLLISGALSPDATVNPPIARAPLYEVYDPATGLFQDAPFATPAVDRQQPVSTSLLEGVLVQSTGFSGAQSAANTEFVAVNGVQPARGMIQARRQFVPLQVGPQDVLVAGGRVFPRDLPLGIELFNTQQGWTQIGNLTKGRFWAPLARYEDSVLVIGGFAFDPFETLRSVEVVDLLSRRIAPETYSLEYARGFFTATTLQDGRVLVMGGARDGFSVTTCELFGPQ